jgi:hypothetical protein
MLLHRYGIVFRELLTGETILPKWRELLITLRRLEDRGEVRGGMLCGYRCITLPVDAREVSPQALLDEIYPLAAYYQDSWSEGIANVRLAGLYDRMAEFREPFERELKCPVASLLTAASDEGRIRSDEGPLVDRGLEALIGWTLNRGA